jgi:D-alanyl-D-alanine carboxypeptidase
MQPIEAAQQADDITVAAIGEVAPVPSARPADLGFDEAVQAAKSLAQPAVVAVAPEPDRPLDVIGAWLSDTFSLGAAPTALGQTAPSAPLLPPVGIGEEGEPLDLMTSGSTAVAAAPVENQPAPAPIAIAETQPETAAPSGWIVQIGASPTENGARSLISDASSKVGTLGAMKPYVERFEKNGQVFFRARFSGFDGRDDAAGVCNEMKKAKMSCLAMQS